MAPRGISTGRLLLLALGLAVAGLVAVPVLVRERGPRDAVTGALRGAPSEELTGVPVLCFAAGSVVPWEIARTDAEGRFAFRAAPARFHVLALPRRGSAFAAAWRVDLEAELDRHVLVFLPAARRLAVLVEDSGGAPVAGAEVGVFALGPDGPLATDLAVTDADGRASVRAPRRAGVGAHARGFAPAFAPAPEDGPARLTLSRLR